MLKNAISATSKADWLTHIRSLGLSSVGEYERWCRKHGFAFNRRKTWRQEREERTIAERERAASKALHHIRALGLKSADEYQLWCQQNGNCCCFSATTSSHKLRMPPSP